jgi:hypothetical protein
MIVKGDTEWLANIHRGCGEQLAMRRRTRSLLSARLVAAGPSFTEGPNCRPEQYHVLQQELSG